VTFKWTVTGPPTSRARFRVTAAGAPGNQTAVDINDAPITFSDPFLRVTPINDLHWAIGSTQTIRWTHNLGVGIPVTVELSRDQGRSWSTLADHVPQKGSESSTWRWTVTGPAAAATIRVRASNEVAAGTLTGVSIGSPFIRLTPMASLSWNACEARILRWTSNLGPAEAVLLLARTDGNATWQPVGQSNRNKMYYAPPERVATVTLRVQWAKDPTVSATTPPFTVLTTPVPNWCDDGQ
jgi:hypothetical protein